MGDWTTENKSSQAPVKLSYYGIYLVYNTSAISERLGLERTLDSREQIEIVDQCLLHRTTALTVRTWVWVGQDGNNDDFSMRKNQECSLKSSKFVEVT